MRFNAKAETDTGSGLFPAGTYDFQVVGAEEGTSRAGNDMVTLTLHVFNQAGSKRTVYDYLAATDKAVFKIKAFALATGLGDKFESGELDAVDMEGRSGRVKLGIEEANGSYPEKNKVVSYLAAAPGSAPARKAMKLVPRQTAAVVSIDDEIPF